MPYRGGSAPAWGHVLRQPTENLFVPELTIRRLQDPVPLVGEIDELGRHPLALQRREQLLPLADRAAEIQVVVDHQHRRFELAELAGKAVRRLLLVALAVLAPGRPAVLPLVEPDLV